MSDSTNSSPKIIVTGDLVLEVHLYQGSPMFASGETSAGTRVKEEWGGARLLQDIQVVERAMQAKADAVDEFCSCCQPPLIERKRRVSNGCFRLTAPWRVLAELFIVM